MSFGRRATGEGAASDREIHNASPAARLRENVVVFSETLKAAADAVTPDASDFESMVDAVVSVLTDSENSATAASATRGELAAMSTQTAEKLHGRAYRALNPIEQRNLITGVVNLHRTGARNSGGGR
jgi:hypothetical protein